MLREAINQRIEPEAIYEAITIGFERTLGVTVSSPPLASDDLQPAGKKDEALLALVRELKKRIDRGRDGFALEGISVPRWTSPTCGQRRGGLYVNYPDCGHDF